MIEKIKEKIITIISSSKDYTDTFSLEEIESGKALSIVSYLIPIIPFILSNFDFFTSSSLNFL